MPKILVVYYSAQAHTERIAKQIADKLKADTFVLEPKEPYVESDFDWTDPMSRVSCEHNDESLRDVELVKTLPDNWAEYDTVIIGYPIWWGIAAWPVNTFIKTADFADKTVIPFCTSHSSAEGGSAKALQDVAKDGNWQEGFRFSQDATDTEVAEWVDDLSI